MRSCQKQQSRDTSFALKLFPVASTAPSNYPNHKICDDSCATLAYWNGNSGNERKMETEMFKTSFIISIDVASYAIHWLNHHWTQ